MKKTFFLLLIMLMALELNAQVESQHESMLVNATNGIVRKDGNNWRMVSYFERGDNGYFMLTDATMTYDAYKICDKWHILDFRIVGPYVVFCGTVTHTFQQTIQLANGGTQINDVQYTVGLIGYFNKTDLSGANSLSYYAIEENSVTRFTKVASLDGTDYLYAIGECGWNDPYIVNGNTLGYYTNHISSIYKIANWQTTINSTPLIYTNINKYNTTDVDLTDLSTTDDHVVAVGNFGDNTGAGLCLVRYGMNDASSGDPYWYYLANDPLSDYHSEGLFDKDQVVVACLAGKDGGYKTNIRFVDLGTMNMVNAQQMPMASKAEPSELAYVKSDASVVMQIYMFGAFLPNTSLMETLHFRIDPFNTNSYSSPAFYHSGNYHSSLACLAAQYAVCFNGYHWLLKDMLQGYYTTCYAYEETEINPLETVNPFYTNCLNMAPINCNSTGCSSSGEPVTINNDCFHFMR